MLRCNGKLRQLPLAVMLLSSSLAPVAFAQGVTTARAMAINIPAQSGVDALKSFVEQTRFQLIYSPDVVRGVTTNAVNGTMTPSEALKKLLDGTGITIVTTGANAATLQNASSDQRRSEEASPEPQVVTVAATRRNEPVQKIPMQVNVLPADDLARNGSTGLRDYMAGEPGVVVSSYGSASANGISIRGVTTGGDTVTTVGVYVDDVATGSSSAWGDGPRSALNMALLDLNHIEVLRGPQGTLYGAGAMGGVLKYVTNLPETDEFNGSATLSASATKGGGPSATENGVVNVPLKEGVAAVRVSAFREHFGGSVDAIGPAAGSNIDHGDTSGARASVLVTPSRNLTLRLTATTQNITRAGNDYVDYDPATSRPLEGDGIRSLAFAEPNSMRTNLFSADVEYDFGWARLNSITTSQRSDISTLEDLTSVYVPLLASIGMNFDSVGLDAKIVQRKTTEELRLTSKSDQHFEWLAGLYWNHEEIDGSDQTESVPAAGTPDVNLVTYSLPSDYREVAAYGDLTWKFDGGLSLTAGARVAQNRQRLDETSSGFLTGPDQELHGRSKDTSKLWLLTAGYAVDANNSVYVRGASGYRPGGANNGYFDSNGKPLAPLSFQPDTLTSFEAGYKGNLIDKRLQVEASVYRIDWHNVQQEQTINGIGVIANGGKAVVNGAELALKFRPLREWSLTASAAYIDAKLTEDAPGLGATSGERLPGSARFSGALSTTYDFALGGYAAYVGASEQHVGERNAGFVGSTSEPSYRLPAYWLTDLQAGIDFKHLRLALFLRNLLDAKAQQSANSTYQLYGGPALVSLMPARTVGMSLTVPF